MGDYESAIKFIRDAFIFADKIEDKSKLCNLYLIYSKFLVYVENYSDLKNILREVYNNCSSNIIKGSALDRLAEIYLFEDSINVANQYLLKSLSIDSNKQYQYYEIKGNYYKKIGDSILAKHNYEIALDKVKSNDSKRSYRKSLVQYAEFLYELDEKEKSIKYAHLALRNYFNQLDSLNVHDRTKIDEQIPDVYIIEAFYLKARYFKEKYIETKDVFAFQESIYYFNLIVNHFDRLKMTYYSSSAKYRLGIKSQQIYSEVISFFVDQFSINNKPEDFNSAFVLSQKANSFVLKSEITNRKILELAGVTEDSVNRYIQLSLEVSSDFDPKTRRGADILFEFDKYIESLNKNYDLKLNTEIHEEISLNEVQKLLDDNSLLIKYHHFDDNLVVFGISKHTMFADKMNLSSELKTLIKSNNNVLSLKENNDSLANTFLVDSKRIYDFILGRYVESNLLEKVDQIIFVPSGPLKTVAFNALAINDSSNWTDPNTYLLSKYSTSYLYYCSQLKNNQYSKKPNNGFVGFGIEYESSFLEEISSDFLVNRGGKNENFNNISLGTLTYADDEVLTCSKICNGTSYTKADVTPENVKKCIDNFNIIHFSTHAFVDESDHFRSFLVFNRDKTNNYQFKYSDILSLNLDAEMVVLSACHTSSGEIVMGEGLMSLSRAFFQSGSKSVVGSYWNAPDYTTKELMILFYKNLKAGMTKSSALRSAQIEFLTDDKLSSPAIRSPFFWASWAIYGNNQPIEIEDSIMNCTHLIILTSLIILTVLSFLIVIRELKKSRLRSK